MSQKVNKNYQMLRMGLLARGTNLRRWAIERGYPVTTVYYAAQQRRSGIEAVKIHRELKEFVHAK